jgi:hypothetical protein
MWIMVRGHGRTHQTINPGSQQIEELRAEIGRLKAERATDNWIAVGACDSGYDRPRQARIVTARGGSRPDLLFMYICSRYVKSSTRTLRSH